MTAIRIERMLYGGSGATATGETFPFVLPNELVEITPANEARILEHSPDRVDPGCIHFGACGGCHYQHAAYPAQIHIKERILRDTFGSAGLSGLPKIEVHSGPEWHYRNRIRLRIGEVDGELRVGYSRRASFEPNAQPTFLPVTMCPIAAPILLRAAEALTALAAIPSNPASLRRWLEALIEVELFTDARQKKLQLTLFVRTSPSGGFADFCGALQQRVPELIGAGVAVLPGQTSGRSRRTERAKPGAAWGAPGMLYDVVFPDEIICEYWVTRGAFFQVNISLLEALAQIVTSSRTGTIAWDLYAGVGLFSRALTNSFAQVTGVEPAEPAAASLAAALKPPHRAVKMTALDFLRAAVVQRERPDLIVMDPPRAGVGPEVCALLGRIRAPELIYVSCDPVTLARDLKQLAGSGYKIGALHLVDMFPQTFHMETVTVLHR